MKSLIFFLISIFSLIGKTVIGAIAYTPAHFGGVTTLNFAKVPQVGHTRAGNAFPIPMDQERSILEYLKNQYAQGVIITQSYLRSTIQAPNISTQTLKFGFQSSAPVNPFLNTDNSLAQSDTFEVTHMSLALWTTAASAAGSTTPAVQNFASIAQRQYFPNKNIFSGTTASTEWQNLLAIYNGLLYIKIDTTVYYESFDMQTFLKVGLAQAGVNYINAQASTQIPFSSGDISHYKVSVVPMFMINGSGKQDIEIKLSDSTLLGSTDAASPTRLNYIEFSMHGFLCQGGAGQKVNKK